jgi:hypothetical protein
MSRFSRTLLASALALALMMPGTGCAEESAAGKSYVIPAAELAAFIFGLNQFNRHVIDSR